MEWQCIDDRVRSLIMAKNVIIRNVTYNDVPAVNIPTADGGMANFVDTSDATIEVGTQLKSGVTAYDGNGTKITGSMPEKGEDIITPTTSDQTINAEQYLVGTQTIKGDVNLVPNNIIEGVSIFGVAGSAAVPVISQDSVSKILSIS